MTSNDMPTPTAAILIIGNEILSGRTQDTNVQFIAERLKKHGIRLNEVRVVLDVTEDIIAAVDALRTNHTFVFTTGGIGGTHDDITAATMAKAFGVAYVVNEEAHKRLLHHYKDHLNENRFQMAHMPAGARLIDNPISGAPGFAMDNVYCLAGMPSVMQGMFVTLLPTLKGGIPFISKSVTCNLREGDIAHALTAIQNQNPAVEIGSYPFFRIPPDIGVSFVVQGQDESVVTVAYNNVLQMISDFGGIIHGDT